MQIKCKHAVSQTEGWPALLLSKGARGGPASHGHSDMLVQIIRKLCNINLITRTNYLFCGGAAETVGRMSYIGDSPTID